MASDTTTTPGEIASRAGLLYLPDDRPGIGRRRRGSGFSYVGPRGGKVGQVDMARIRGLVIPPAWRDVWVAPEADAHLQATGVDAAGRKQYLYHRMWRESADAAKFDRLADFAPALTSLRQRVAHDLRARNGDLLCATVTRLIDRCLIRPGSRPGATGDATGATGLGRAHVVTAGRTVLLDFVGKSGVDQHVEVQDRELSRVLADLLEAADEGEPLFRTENDAVDARRLNAYIGQASRSEFTAKDFRTWGATVTVVAELGPTGRADTMVVAGAMAERERAAIAAAADVLGNTAAVCRASYVAPAVVAAFESGGLARHWLASRQGKWLSRAERATARVLDAAR